MPRIPTTQAPGSLRTQGASISTGIAGAVGAAFSDVAEGVQRAMKAKKEADDVAFVTKATNSFLRQETERLDGIMTRGEDVDMSSLQSSFQERISKLAENAPSQDARNELLAQADNAFTRKFFPAYSGHQSKLNVGRRVDATTGAIDDIVSEVLTGRTSVPEALGRLESAVTGLEATSAGVVDIPALRQSSQNQIALASLTSRIQQGDQEAVYKEVQEGKWDALTTSDQLTSIQKQALKAQVDADSRIQEEVEKRNALVASDLEISVFRDQATYSDIDRALNTGVITPAKRTELYKRLDSNAEGKAKKADNLTRVRTSLSMGIPLDPTSKEDREGVEQMWESILPDLDTADPDNFANSVVSFVQSTGILPASLKGNLAAFARSGNPDQASQAADIISRMQDVNSPALNDLTKESYAFGLSVMDLVRGGIDQGQAVEIARKNAFGLTAQEKKTASLVLKGASKENQTFLNDKLDEFDPGLFSAQPEVTPVLQAEFEVLLGEMMPFTGGNIESARNMAWQSLRNTWGATTVNGGIQVMKYAPEAIYGKSGDASWIAPQFDADMMEMGIEQGKAFIVSDIKTARTDQPSYPVFVTDDNGVAKPLLDENNLPLRWKPEFKSSPQYKELKAEQDRRIRQAKFKRTIKETRQRWKEERGEMINRLDKEYFNAINQ